MYFYQFVPPINWVLKSIKTLSFINCLESKKELNVIGFLYEGFTFDYWTNLTLAFFGHFTLSFPEISQWSGIHWRATNFPKWCSLRINFWQFKTSAEVGISWDSIENRASLTFERMTISVNLPRKQKCSSKIIPLLLFKHYNVFYQYPLKYKKWKTCIKLQH